MYIDRPMINLFFEIKRALPLEDQNEMKLSSPDLREQMVTLYKNTQNTQVKQLIEFFLRRAGHDWLAKINPKPLALNRLQLTKEINPKQNKPSYYRGALVE